MAPKPIPDKASHSDFPHVQSMDYAEHADQPGACCKTQENSQSTAEKTENVEHVLRGPAAILFISRDTCSDSIAKLFRACFHGYRTIIARYVAKWGIAQVCLCKTKVPRGGVSHHFGGVLTSLKKYRVIWGIAAIVSQYRAIWGH